MRETLSSEPLINFGAGSFRNLHGLTRICGHSVNVFIVVCATHLVPCSVPICFGCSQSLVRCVSKVLPSGLLCVSN